MADTIPRAVGIRFTARCEPPRHPRARALNAMTGHGVLAKAIAAPVRIMAASNAGCSHHREKIMDRRMFAAAALIAGLVFAAPANAKGPCRDGKGHYIKCDAVTATAAPSAAPATAPVPSATPAPSASVVAPAPSARCRDAKGHYAKCDTATVPVSPSARAAPAPRAAPMAPQASPASGPAMRAAPVGAKPQDTNPAGPGGATAKCRDNSMSFSKHHSGTCSRHGGVAQWF